MSYPSAYSLNAIAPGDVDRFTVANNTRINNPQYRLPVSRSKGDASHAPNATSLVSLSVLAVGKLIHPEGSVIFCHENVVSNQPLTEAHLSLADFILSECDELVDMPVTVFIELYGWKVNYYVVAHESKSIAWAGESPDSLRGATSTKHEHEYWIHMENFPGPYFSTPDDLQLLKNVLASSAIDAATSDGSTSPMSVQQIETGLRQLNEFSTKSDIHQTYASG